MALGCALAPESTVFDNCPDEARFKAYNLGKGKGMSVLDILAAMREVTGFDFKYEITERRFVLKYLPAELILNQNFRKGDVPYLIARALAG